VAQPRPLLGDRFDVLVVEQALVLFGVDARVGEGLLVGGELVDAPVEGGEAGDVESVLVRIPVSRRRVERAVRLLVNSPQRPGCRRERRPLRHSSFH